MLIGHSNVRKNDTVLEIGAGTGVITFGLAKRCKRVIALEPDSETAEKLFCHKNTVRYRIRRIHELLGETLDEENFRESLALSVRVLLLEGSLREI